MEEPKVIELKKTYDFYNYLTKNVVSKILEDFKHKLHFENRFFNETHPVFCYLKKTLEEHTNKLSQNDLVYRARIAEEKFNFCKEGYFEEDFYGYNKKDSFVPPENKMQANRANAEGIPCLYAAKDEKTAVAEVRPFIGNRISVATIQVKRDLKIYDLFFDLSKSEKEIINYTPFKIWLGIAIAFSIPHENNAKNEYLLTQCISEYIQLAGFDGIQYSSSLDEGGKNLVLFNCKNIEDGGNYEICEPIFSHVCIVSSIKHRYGFIN